MCCQPLIHVYYSDDTHAPRNSPPHYKNVSGTRTEALIYLHLLSAVSTPAPAPLSLMIVAVRIYGIHLMSPFVIANMYVNIQESLSKLRLPVLPSPSATINVDIYGRGAEQSPLN